MSDTEISVRELRDHLADYLRKVRGGERFVITSRGQPVARLSSPEARLSRAQLFGIMKDEIWMAPDFDADDPDIVEAAEADLD